MQVISLPIALSMKSAIQATLPGSNAGSVSLHQITYVIRVEVSCLCCHQDRDAWTY